MLRVPGAHKQRHIFSTNSHLVHYVPVPASGSPSTITHFCGNNIGGDQAETSVLVTLINHEAVEDFEIVNCEKTGDYSCKFTFERIKLFMKLIFELNYLWN